ncbi:hypothetical protein MMM127_14750 [Helicobacter pylori]
MLGLLTLTDNQANMDNSTPKDRAKILIEELKILQGVINRIVQNSLECKKWTLALAMGVLSLKIEAISHLYGLCVLGVLLICFYLLGAYYLTQERLLREQWLIENRLKTDERLFEVFPFIKLANQRNSYVLCFRLAFFLIGR